MLVDEGLGRTPPPAISGNGSFSVSPLFRLEGVQFLDNIYNFSPHSLLLGSLFPLPTALSQGMYSISAEESITRTCCLRILKLRIEKSSSLISTFLKEGFIIIIILRRKAILGLSAWASQKKS